jgi:hypothetical protein
MIRWYLGAVLTGAVSGWAAATLHLSGWAPVGLASVGVGLVLGVVLLRLAAMTSVTLLRPLVAGAIISALVAVLVEHAWLYHDFRRQWQDARAREPQVALFRPAEPWSPARYFRHELSPGRATLWCVDAALIVLASVGTVSLGRKAGTQTVVTDESVPASTSDP